MLFYIGTNSDRKKLNYGKMNVEFRIEFHYHVPYLLSSSRWYFITPTSSFLQKSEHIIKTMISQSVSLVANADKTNSSSRINFMKLWVIKHLSLFIWLWCMAFYINRDKEWKHTYHIVCFYSAEFVRCIWLNEFTFCIL